MPASDKLTDTAIRALKPGKRVQKAFDGGGLYLMVVPSGQRYWRLKYRVDGKEKLISLGVYPAVSLKDARKKRAEAKGLLASRKDPSRERQSQKAARRKASENTFEAVAREWFKKKSPKWAESHSSIVIGRLEKNAFPWIGQDPITELTRDQILRVLRRVEERGAVETAHRLRQYVDSVFKYAISTDRLTANPTPTPEALASAKKGHFASITEPRAVGALLRATREYQGTFVTQCALKLAPYVFARPGELRRAEWREFDLDAAEWRISPEKMKSRSPHIVPLSKQAIRILRELQPLTGRGKYLFPSVRGRGRSMSSNTINAALRALGFTKEQMTGHGFRHMASTILNESSLWNADAIERQLAHQEQDETRAAYNWAEYLPERKKMMQWWADRLDALAAASNVVGVKARA